MHRQLNHASPHCNRAVCTAACVASQASRPRIASGSGTGCLYRRCRCSCPPMPPDPQLAGPGARACDGTAGMPSAPASRSLPLLEDDSSLPHLALKRTSIAVRHAGSCRPCEQAPEATGAGTELPIGAGAGHTDAAVVADLCACLTAASYPAGSCNPGSGTVAESRGTRVTGWRPSRRRFLYIYVYIYIYIYGGVYFVFLLKRSTTEPFDIGGRV